MPWKPESDKQPFVSSTRIAHSTEVLEQIAISNSLTYEELINGAHDFLDTGAYLSEGEKYEGCYVGDDFWVHFRIVTGRKFSKNDAWSFFSCSC